MSYRLGVDVGGTFTDVLLVDEDSGSTWRAKTASTPADQAIGVLNGIGKACAEAGIELREIAQVLHGTTVATNAILEGKGATVGLVTTKGFRQVLQIARSYVPGGLAGWIIWPKPEPLAALENTVEVDERIASDGSVVRELDEADVRAQLAKLEGPGHPGARGQPDQLLRRRRAREADRRDRRRGAARRPGVAVLRRAAGDARVRAHADHGRQRLRPAAGEEVHADPGRPARRGRRRRGAGHPAQRRRPAGGDRRHRRPGHACCCPARPAASPARCGSPSSAATAT